MFCTGGSGRSGTRTDAVRRLVEFVLLLAILTLAPRAHSAEPANGSGATETDTLVAYIEALEFDLAVQRADFVAVEDSLQVELRVLGWELEALRGNQRRWWDDQRLWFLIGAVSAVVVMGSAVQITF